MLYAASVKISLGKNRRRVDLIVEAPDLEQAKEKAVKQAKKIYCPGKKAIYAVNVIISESEAAGLDGASHDASGSEPS